jgi:hypothetical protein
MFDTVQGHPTVVLADNEFAYSADKKKLYRLDERKQLLDLETGKWIGLSLIPSSLANTPGYEIKPLG